MRNYVQTGNMITIVAPSGGVFSDQGILYGNLFGIVSKNAAAGEEVEIATHGVFDLPKAANATFTEGQRVSWDAAEGHVVLPASGMVPIGISQFSAENGRMIARIRLDGISTAAAV